ncbi:MAG: response regulator [Bacteroidetes bacterium]|nr:response regulator [Bacteroidota bacterium]
MDLYKNILLIDDDDGDLTVFSRALKALDPAIICHTADNGLHGLNLIRRLPELDLIFVDLNMPGMDGFEYLQALKLEPAYRGIPCIAWTSSVDENNRKKAMDLGAAGFIIKPTDVDKLKIILRHVLSGELSVQL